MEMTIHHVLAGSYRGKRASLKATLTHASVDGGETALCGKVQAGNLCDVFGTEPGTELTCGGCKRAAAKAK